MCPGGWRLGWAAGSRRGRSQRRADLGGHLGGLLRSGRLLGGRVPRRGRARDGPGPDRDHQAPIRRLGRRRAYRRARPGRPDQNVPRGPRRHGGLRGERRRFRAPPREPAAPPGQHVARRAAQQLLVRRPGALPQAGRPERRHRPANRDVRTDPLRQLDATSRTRAGVEAAAPSREAAGQPPGSQTGKGTSRRRETRVDAVIRAASAAGERR